jgi:hypothetical protein
MFFYFGIGYVCKLYGIAMPASSSGLSLFFFAHSFPADYRHLPTKLVFTLFLPEIHIKP